MSGGETRAFRAVLDSVPDATLAVDRAGQIEYANEPAVTLFGYHRSELLGEPIEVLLPRGFAGNASPGATPLSPRPRPGRWASASISTAGTATGRRSPST